MGSKKTSISEDAEQGGWADTEKDTENLIAEPLLEGGEAKSDEERSWVDTERDTEKLLEDPEE